MEELLWSWLLLAAAVLLVVIAARCALVGLCLSQVEHHLFPRIPRHNLHKIRAPIRELCERHGLKFSIVSLLEANKMLVRSFWDVAQVARNMDVAAVRGFYSGGHISIDWADWLPPTVCVRMGHCRLCVCVLALRGAVCVCFCVCVVGGGYV